MSIQDPVTNVRPASRLSQRVVAAALLWCCATATAAQNAPVTHPDDEGLFRAIIRFNLDSANVYRIQADPRAVAPSAAPLDIMKPTYLKLPRDVLERRKKVLMALGVEIVDAALEFANPNCPGGMVLIPLADSTKPDTLHARCPRDFKATIALGLPREGKAQVAHGKAYDAHRLEAAVGYWAVRVVRFEVGPHGSGFDVHDFVVGLDKGCWRVLQRVPVAFIE
jgi:hypothetical protein